MRTLTIMPNLPLIRMVKIRDHLHYQYKRLNRCPSSARYGPKGIGFHNRKRLKVIKIQFNLLLIVLTCQVEHRIIFANFSQPFIQLCMLQVHKILTKYYSLMKLDSPLLSHHNRCEGWEWFFSIAKRPWEVTPNHAICWQSWTAKKSFVFFFSLLHQFCVYWS